MAFWVIGLLFLAYLYIGISLGEALNQFRQFLIDWKSVVEWLVGIGTVALAFLAVFQDRVRRWFERPKFRIRVKNGRPDCVAYPLLDGSGSKVGDCLNVRIWVENYGNSAATDVEVYAHEVFKEVRKDDWQPLGQFIPMNLNWSDIEPRAIYFRSIAPHMGKHCNLGQVVPAGQSGVSLIFLTILQPSNAGNVVGPGKYRVDLRIAAGNATPTRKLVELHVSGWYQSEAEMLEKGISVKVIEP